MAPRTAVLNLAWIVKLRWVAILGLTLAVPVAERAVHVALPNGALAMLIGAGILSNLAASWALRRERASRKIIRGLLLIDVGLLTLALYFAGGIYNPFVSSYLVLVVLASVLLGRRAAAHLALLAGTCVLMLGVRHQPLRADHVHDAEHAHAGEEHHHPGDVDSAAHVRVHAEDMWLAFLVLAALIAYLGNWSMRQRELELAALRADKERNERLAELGALAANAAHEIASPLTTIAVVSKELVHALERGDDLSGRADDVRLIREEVGRCRAALDAMARRARGEEDGPVRLSELMREARARVPEPGRVEVELDGDALVCAPRAALVEVLRGLLANACEASPGDARVHMRVRGEGARCRIDVLDSGAGIDGADFGRIGVEPFTTKGTMGMGLFAGRAVVERLGGELELASRPGRGTRVTLRLPVVRA